MFYYKQMMKNLTFYSSIVESHPMTICFAICKIIVNNTNYNRLNRKKSNS